MLRDLLEHLGGVDRPYDFSKPADSPTSICDDVVTGTFCERENVKEFTIRRSIDGRRRVLDSELLQKSLRRTSYALQLSFEIGRCAILECISPCQEPEGGSLKKIRMVTYRGVLQPDGLTNSLKVRARVDLLR